METKEKTTTAKLSQVFQLFVGNDDQRPLFLKPFEHNGYVYATDVYVLIRTAKEHYDAEIDNPVKSDIDPTKVIPTPNMDYVLNINKEDFEKFKDEDEYRVTEEQKDCNTCDGTGEVEWEFERHTMDSDCPDCDGSGVSEDEVKEKTGNKTFGVYKVKLINSYFQIHLFYKLLQVQEAIGGDIHLIYQDNPSSASLFKIGNCEILIMPTYVDNELGSDAVLYYT